MSEPPAPAGPAPAVIPGQCKAVPIHLGQGLLTPHLALARRRPCATHSTDCLLSLHSGTIPGLWTTVSAFPSMTSITLVDMKMDKQPIPAAWWVRALS